MSNLIVNNINGQHAQAGKAKAWSFLQVLSGVPTALDSFNVSSLTDAGAGRYGHNFTNAMANTYFVLTALSKGDATNSYIYPGERFDSTRTPFYCEPGNYSYVNGSHSDVGGAGYGFSTTVHGELA